MCSATVWLPDFWLEFRTPVGIQPFKNIMFPFNALLSLCPLPQLRCITVVNYSICAPAFLCDSESFLCPYTPCKFMGLVANHSVYTGWAFSLLRSTGELPRYFGVSPED
ncbi:hypothetical protein TNCV_1029961 [Trichonephila clavipes]|nr:hypothetical protein TNCV_1029961 [Trichonephila clavipes]